jgi:hypothetical protein
MWRVLSFAIVAAAAVALSACNGARPPWASPPAGAHSGDATVGGAPVTIPKAATAPSPQIVADGRLDDAAWQNAAVLGPLADCGDGRAVSRSPVAAFARMTWDARGLWLGFIVDDDQPTSPFSRDDVDPHVWGASSGIELMLQPGDPGDNRDYYELQIDVHGAVFDSHFEDYNSPITGSTPKDRVFGHQDWSSHVERAVTTGKGWYAIEAMLPWSAIAGARVDVPPKPGDVWRANLYSFRDGQRQALCWSPLRGQGNFHRASRFGRIQFQ